jgi:hypothetical protein
MFHQQMEGLDTRVWLRPGSSEKTCNAVDSMYTHRAELFVLRKTGIALHSSKKLINTCLYFLIKSPRKQSCRSDVSLEGRNVNFDISE